MTARPKVFCFFSSEKKALPCLPDVPDTGDLLCLTTEVHHTVAESAAIWRSLLPRREFGTGDFCDWVNTNPDDLHAPTGQTVKFH